MQKKHFPASLLVCLLLSSSACTSAIKQTASQDCKEPRSQLCTMDYTPVCGQRKDQSTQTYSNACSACSHPEVIRFTAGECSKTATPDK